MNNSLANRLACELDCGDLFAGVKRFIVEHGRLKPVCEDELDGGNMIICDSFRSDSGKLKRLLEVKRLDDLLSRPADVVRVLVYFAQEVRQVDESLRLSELFGLHWFLRPFRLAKDFLNSCLDSSVELLNC